MQSAFKRLQRLDHILGDALHRQCGHFFIPATVFDLVFVTEQCLTVAGCLSSIFSHRYFNAMSIQFDFSIVVLLVSCADGACALYIISCRMLSANIGTGGISHEIICLVHLKKKRFHGHYTLLSCELRASPGSPHGRPATAQRSTVPDWSHTGKREISGPRMFATLGGHFSVAVCQS